MHRHDLLMHQAIHQNIANRLLDEYEGQEPLANYLKKYFAANKKHGSRDRKNISSLCYEQFRKDVSKFPLQQFISKQIDIPTFIHSHQTQPLLFIRVRPWQTEKVVDKLHAAHIEFKKESEHCFSFANTTSLQNVLLLNKEAVIQDKNSQALAALLKLVPTQIDQVIHVWDACAASGGKTILMYDYMDNIKIHVSDVRESILKNCEKRLQEANIKPTSMQVIDLTLPFSIKKQFDFVFADLPCSGSGTWGRTPEQLKFFKEYQLDQYTALQKQIVQNIIPTVKLNGYLLLATCSVYEQENEKNVASLLSTGKFRLIEEKYFEGYREQADTLFGAIFEKIAE